MEFVLYFIFGSIVSVINWLFVVSKETKEQCNACISLALGTVLWPAVFSGWFYKVTGYINRKYVTVEN